jgi:hypothetical protein
MYSRVCGIFKRKERVKEIQIIALLLIYQHGKSGCHRLFVHSQSVLQGYKDLELATDCMIYCVAKEIGPSCHANVRYVLLVSATVIKTGFYSKLHIIVSNYIVR